MDENSNTTNIIKNRIPILNLLNNTEKWCIFILSPIFGSLGLIGNLFLFIFLIKSNLNNIRFSIKLLLLYSLIQIIMSITLISCVPIIINTYFESSYIIKEKKFISKFNVAFLFFLSFTLFCVLFLAVLLLLIAFDRFINVHLVLRKNKSVFQILTWIILLLLFNIIAVNSYYANKFCPSYCLSTIVTIVIYLKSLLLQIIFYCLISVKLIRKNKVFQRSKVVPTISNHSELSNGKEKLTRLPKTGK